MPDPQALEPYWQRTFRARLDADSDALLTYVERGRERTWGPGRVVSLRYPRGPLVDDGRRQSVLCDWDAVRAVECIRG